MSYVGALPDPSRLWLNNAVPKEMHPLSTNQARALLRTAAASGNRLEALFVVAVHTGMRPGELLALRWEDVRFEGTPVVLEVRRSLSASQFTATKTGKGRRVALSWGPRKHSGPTANVS